MTDNKVQELMVNLGEIYDVRDLKALADNVTTIQDFFWLLQMTGLCPGLNKQTFRTLMLVAGIDPDDQFSDEMAQAVIDTPSPKPGEVLGYMVNMVKDIYTLSDAKVFLLEKVRSFEDFRQFLCLIEDIELYDGMDTLDLMFSLLERQWSPTDEVSPTYTAAWKIYQGARM